MSGSGPRSVFTWKPCTQERADEMLNILPPIYGPAGSFMVSEPLYHETQRIGRSAVEREVPVHQMFVPVPGGAWLEAPVAVNRRTEGQADALKTWKALQEQRPERHIVVLELRVTTSEGGDEPGDWDWHERLGLAPNESVELRTHQAIPDPRFYRKEA